MAVPARERPTVTLVTSDLKGSTALGERLDPEALREVLNRYFAVMRAIFESHGGRIEKIIGDAIVAVFGLPEPADDDALRAVEAAAESMRALATLNDELEAGWGVRLVTRTGVASGAVTFGEDLEGQHVLLGAPVEISGVMEQNAPPLEVLVAESTRLLAGDAAEVETMEPVSPEGPPATRGGPSRSCSPSPRSTPPPASSPVQACCGTSCRATSMRCDWPW